MEKCVIKPEFSCENTVIKNSDVLELLGVTVDEKLKFGMHVKKVCRKVSQQVAFLKRMSNMLPFETRLSIFTPPSLFHILIIVLKAGISAI